MDNPQRNRIEDLRLREREMQAEEALATLNQLEKRDELYAKRDGTLYTNFRRHQQEAPAPPTPTPPPPSLHISKGVYFEKSAFPCYVMSLTNLCSLDRLPKHEEAYQADLLQILTETSHASTRHQNKNCRAKCYTCLDSRDVKCQKAEKIASHHEPFPFGTIHLWLATPLSGAQRRLYLLRAPKLGVGRPPG